MDPECLLIQLMEKSNAIIASALPAREQPEGDAFNGGGTGGSGGSREAGGLGGSARSRLEKREETEAKPAV